MHNDDLHGRPMDCLPDTELDRRSPKAWHREMHARLRSYAESVGAPLASILALPVETQIELAGQIPHQRIDDSQAAFGLRTDPQKDALLLSPPQEPNLPILAIADLEPVAATMPNTVWSGRRMGARLRKQKIEQLKIASSASSEKGVSEMSSNSERNGRWSKGTSGNPSGRPAGSRNRSTEALKLLLEGEGEALIRKAVEMALKGDCSCLKLCLQMIFPARKERSVCFDLSPVTCSEEIPKRFEDLTVAIAEGTITPAEGEIIAGILTSHAKNLRQAETDRAEEESNREIEEGEEEEEARAMAEVLLARKSDGD